MLERRLIEVEGTVQGVGFRPYVHRLAVESDLRGFVQNGALHVLIDVEGDPRGLDAFCRALVATPPPLSRIGRVRVASAAPRAYESFEIAASTPDTRDGAHFDIPPDVATCAPCLAELFSPTNRRFAHPFITCTDCGPRFSVVHGVPYDRERTAMREFALCGDCRREYDDPADRRFHAETIACPHCGPTLVAHAGAPNAAMATGADALALAASTMQGGGIVAIKALGGFQLACDASNEVAVCRLRLRKRRAAKPLAVMVTDAREAARLCAISPAEIDCLTSPERPIVVLARHAGLSDNRPIAASVAPGRTTLGIMLPSTPVHHLLLALLGNPALVMTSGNRSGEPVVTDDDDALQVLGSVADLFLTHNRRIESRCDDSVVRVVAGAPTVGRRARGCVPRAVALPFTMPAPVLATGSHLKNTVCLVHGRSAQLSAHVGDLDSLAGMTALRRAVEGLTGVSGVHPMAVAHDLHPEYGSTRFAEAFASDHGIEHRVPVQHHHAHVAACTAEHGLRGPVIGVAFDGAGLGTDGALWGGEFLVVDGARFTRHGHLGYVPLPGGDAAARRPWRSAVAHLANAGAETRWLAELLPAPVRTAEWALVEQIMRRDAQASRTSSIGRLFDAVASMTGVCHVSRFEGEAAIALEDAAAGHAESRYVVTLREGPPWTADPAEIVSGVAADAKRGRTGSQIAAAFHGALRDLVVLGCERVRGETGLATVTLTGGVFANKLLTECAIEALVARGFRVHLPRAVPCNDGGLSLGQAYVAACALHEEGLCV